MYHFPNGLLMGNVAHAELCALLRCLWESINEPIPGVGWVPVRVRLVVWRHPFYCGSDTQRWCLQSGHATTQHTCGEWWGASAVLLPTTDLAACAWCLIEAAHANAETATNGERKD